MLLVLFTLISFAELDQSLQGLLSFERLDRASPDLWPEQSEFIKLKLCLGKFSSVRSLIIRKMINVRNFVIFFTVEG